MGVDTDEPRVDPVDGSITFVEPRSDGPRPVSVWFHLRAFGADPRFRPDGRGHWVARIPAPPVDRLEYLLVVRAADGTESMVPDPSNHSRVPGVFGDKSVLELPAYRAPEWLTTESPAWPSQPFDVATGTPGIAITGELLTPPGSTTSEPLPLLVVHDGPEYSRLARLGDYLTWLSTRNPELRCRVLLLKPDDRDLSYAASATYTTTLVETALPLVRSMVPTVGAVVGLGASLGALALAHAAASYPEAFGGLLCQSGSFFLPSFDAHEVRFRYYDAVVAAVEQLYAGPSPLAGLVLGLTAGIGEENLDNNRALADRLGELGVDVTLSEGRDGHNHTAWRDLLHPALAQVLTQVWENAGGERT